MKIFKEGDKSKAVCHHCKELVVTTFRVQDAKIKDAGVSYNVPDVLVAICDQCDVVVSVPQQSFAAVAEVRRKTEKKSLNVRVPRHLLDILNVSIVDLGIQISADLRSQLLRLYIASASKDSGNKVWLTSNLDSELLRGGFKRSSRFSMKITPQLEDCFKEMQESSGLTKTEVIDSLIVEIKEDILEKKNPAKRSEVMTALLAMG
jgi:hypothetical protein